MAEDLPTEALFATDADRRESAARRVREVAVDHPVRLHGSLGRLADALADDSERVRRDVANALFEVGVDDPAAVDRVAEALVDALDDETTAVRACAARPIAELAGERPRRLRFAVDQLIAALTDVKSVRYNAARTLAALAPRYPELLATDVDPLTRALLDDYHPVQVAVLRALTALERAYPGMLDVLSKRLQELLVSDVAAVRQAACRAVATADQSWSRSTLRDRSQEDPHPLVRETARGELTALTAAPAPADRTADLRGTAAFEGVTRGRWLAVRVDREGHPFLVGRVTAICREECDADAQARRTHGVRREDFQTRQAWLAAPRVEPSGRRVAVHLHNPFAEYGVNLLRTGDGLAAEHTLPDRDGTERTGPETITTVSPDRARLLAATPGDRLAFELEGTAHDIRVTTAGERDGVYRVGGENRRRGYWITFRPLETEPMMAVFEEGRAFRAENVQLTDD